MGTMKVAARNVEPGDELLIGEDGQREKVRRVVNTGATVTIETPVSIKNCPPDERVEIVIGSDD